MNDANLDRETGEAPATDDEIVIDPMYLDISKTQDGILLQIGEQPLLLWDGTPVIHSKLALIEHIREEFFGFGTISLDASGYVIKPKVFSSYALLSAQQQFAGTVHHPFVAEFSKWLLLDPCLSRCAGPEACDQIARWQPLSDFFETYGLSAPDFPQIPVDLEEEDDVEAVVRKLWLIAPDERDETGHIERAATFAERVSEIFSRLGPE